MVLNHNSALTNRVFYAKLYVELPFASAEGDVRACVLQEDVMEHWDPMKGAERAQVKWFDPDKGFGFLLIPGQGDLFFHIGDRLIYRYEPHASGDPHCVGSAKPSKPGEYRNPKREGGEWVRFGRWQSRDGKPKAIEWDFVEEYDKAKTGSEKLRKTAQIKRDLGRAPSRNVAGTFDLPIPGPRERSEYGHDRVATGIEWWEYFKDAKTGEIYKIRCWDGENGGRGAYSEKDEEFRHRCYYALLEGFRIAARDLAAEIRISRNERALMQGFTHAALLENVDGSNGEQSNDGLEGGLVGHFHGIPVVCDLELADNLPSRETETAKA